ncbi:Pancreatic triacylglycerol lipase (Fragment) [Anthophora quadrimaculata]
MKVYALISFLFVCTVTAVPVIEDREENAENTIETTLTGFNPFQELFMFDDNDKIVPLITTESNPETLEETKRNLSQRIFFLLYTRETANTPEQLRLDDVETLEKSHFDPKKETKFITHGWINSPNSQACTLIVEAFMQHGDYNIIVIDWSTISVMPYLWASERVVMVSQYTSTMIDFLVSQGMDPSKLTIVGHSLGAHVAGLSSHYAKAKANYVVALDPAMPNFLLAGPGNRVSTEDAKFVQVIHTNGGVLGYVKAIGHVDFYPNGGRLQAGCVVDMAGSCSHLRSVQYFAESINSKVGFIAKSCKSYIAYTHGDCDSNASGLMGGVTPNFNLTGKYYLKTHRLRPFALGSGNN